MKKSILVIDNEPKIVDILETFLKIKGFDVKTACNGEMAFDILRKNKEKIDLIVIDEKMPGISGSCFLKNIRTLDVDIPVIGLTGSVNVERVKNKNKGLYKHVFSKPIRLSELFQVISKIL
ncbi:MAG: response regulator [Candidatus Omnitrophota bacterium]